MSRPSLQGLWDNVGKGGKRDFMVSPAARHSYDDLADGVLRWLAAFDANGLAQGDRIFIRTANEFAMVSSFVAALLDGVVPVAVSADLPDKKAVDLHSLVEAAAQVFDSEQIPDALAGVPKTIAIGGREAPKKGFLGLRRKVDPLAGLDERRSIRSPRLPADEDGLAYILFTSGTTSSPSGVMITRGNLLAQLATLGRVFSIDADSRIFNDMSLAHSDGLVQGPTMALAARGSIVRAGGFELSRIEDWLDSVRRERITHFITVPTVWAMIDAYAKHDDYFDAPECAALMSVASRLPDELWHRLEKRFSKAVFNQYGLTETVVTALYAGPGEQMGGVGTIGKPIDCEARIDPATAASGEGELQLRGANIFPGYWRNDERTAASFTQDGWLKTGDLARLREDGAFEILGRIKSVILKGGFLIRPDEIDEAMLRHPAVVEAVTVGIEDKIFGEIPVTGLVGDVELDDAALVNHARKHLESNKVPHSFVQLDAIPRGISGKPQLERLRSILEREGPENRSVANGAAAATGSDLGDAILELAKDVFRAEPGMLDHHSRPGDVPGWDSFSQLGFVMAVEQQFGIAIPASRVAAIATISDMVRTVEELRG